MLTATFTFDPTGAESDAGDVGHEAGLSEGSAMHTKPVVALTCGTVEGIAKAVSKRRVPSERSIFSRFKNFQNRPGGAE